MSLFGTITGLLGIGGGSSSKETSADRAQGQLTDLQREYLQRYLEQVGNAELKTAGNYANNIEPALQQGLASILFNGGGTTSYRPAVTPSVTPTAQPQPQTTQTPTTPTTTQAAAPTASNWSTVYQALKANGLGGYGENELKSILAGGTMDNNRAIQAAVNSNAGIAQYFKNLGWKGTYPTGTQTPAATTPANTNTNNPVSGTGTLGSGAGAGASTTPAGQTFNASQWGFGQTVDAPTIGDYSANWSTLNDSVPDWRNVGSQYEKTMSLNDLLNRSEQARATGTNQQANLAARGLGGSTMSGNQQAALGNMVAIQRAKQNAETLNDRLSLEQSLRNEGVNNWYNRTNLQNQMTGQNNQNAWQKAGWQAEQQNQKKNDFWNINNFLSTGGTPSNLSSGISGLGALSGQYGQMASNAFNRQQQADQNTQNTFENLGSLYNIFSNKKKKTGS